MKLCRGAERAYAIMLLSLHVHLELKCRSFKLAVPLPADGEPLPLTLAVKTCQHTHSFRLESKLRRVYSDLLIEYGFEFWQVNRILRRTYC